MKKMAKVISLVNAKGGSGKTTTASNFAFCLSQKKFKVLCIDLDFQCNLSLTLGCEDYNKRKFTISELINYVSRGVELPNKNEYVVNCFPNLDLIPNNELFDDNVFSAISGEDFIKKLLFNSNLIYGYDYIIIDNHPNNPQNNATLKAVLVASDKLLIPVSPCEFDQQGVFTFINILINFIREKQDKINVRIAGLLPTRQKKREILSIDTLEFCKNSGEYSFKNYIPESTGIGQSHKIHGVLCSIAPKNIAAKAYENFTEEFLNLYGGEN